MLPQVIVISMVSSKPGRVVPLSCYFERDDGVVQLKRKNFISQEHVHSTSIRARLLQNSPVTYTNRSDNKQKNESHKNEA